MSRGQMSVSLPAEYRTRLEVRARESGRSLSREAALLLQEALEPRDWPGLLASAPFEVLQEAWEARNRVNPDLPEEYRRRLEAGLDTDGSIGAGPSASSPGGEPAEAVSPGAVTPEPPSGPGDGVGGDQGAPPGGKQPPAPVDESDFEPRMVSGSPLHGSQPPQGILGELLSAGKVFKGSDPKIRAKARRR